MDDDYGIETYGDRIAEFYDMLEAPGLVTDLAVSCLAELAGAGPALELGIGTGRVALPLQSSGVEVHGIEASSAMIRALQAKPGGHALTVIKGDFADVDAPGRYSVVFAAFDTFCALRNQGEQVRCFANVARVLRPDGAFVVESSVPDPSRFSRGQDIQLRFVDANLLVLHVARHMPDEQRIVGQYVVASDGSLRTFPAQVRYVWPSELDLMARLAGLRLSTRWGGWSGQPFTPTSTSHVSVYRSADAQ